MLKKSQIIILLFFKTTTNYKFLEQINYNQKIEYSEETPNPNNKFSIITSDNKNFISFNKQDTDIYTRNI